MVPKPGFQLAANRVYSCLFYHSTYHTKGCSPMRCPSCYVTRDGVDIHGTG